MFGEECVGGEEGAGYEGDAVVYLEEREELEEISI